MLSFAVSQVMVLLEKTNSDWWKAQRGSGLHGYVPANYVKEIEPKIVKKAVKVPKIVKKQRKKIIKQDRKEKDKVKRVKVGLKRKPSSSYFSLISLTMLAYKPKCSFHHYSIILTSPPSLCSLSHNYNQTTSTSNTPPHYHHHQLEHKPICTLTR